MPYKKISEEEKKDNLCSARAHCPVPQSENDQGMKEALEVKPIFSENEHANRHIYERFSTNEKTVTQLQGLQKRAIMRPTGLREKV